MGFEVKRAAVIIRLLALGAGALCGCAVYHPAPLEPARLLQQFEDRSLSNPGLCAYLKTNLGERLSSCPQEWDLATLTLVGFYYSPDITVAGARFEQARAAVITASARPNPTLSIGPQYSTRAIPSVVPWGIGMFHLDVLIETAGKRGYRIAAAERQAEAAQFQLGESAWKVRAGIRKAFLDYLIAIREESLSAEEVEALGQTAVLMSQRVTAGEASQPELSFAESVLQQARVRAAQAAARVPEARNALGVALGVPVEALQGVRLSWAGLERPPEQTSLSPRTIQRLALMNRIDLRSQLAQYAAADETLKLEIAKQYPDITIGSGYAWDGGDNIFELGPSIVLPVFSQNQGPIAEAQTRRKELRAQFLALQENIIGQARGALERYRGALRALDAARQAESFQSRRLEQTQRAFSVGEVDALFLSQNRLQELATRDALLTTLGNAQGALGVLEDSVQRPLDGGDVGSFVFPRANALPPDEGGTL